MRTVTQEQVLERLQALGLRPGDGLLVHSAIQFLGQPQGGVGMYFEALDAAIEFRSGNGTLAVPTFNFSFARGEPYDPAETPSQGMGAFSEWVRQHPTARRTPHPLQSLAVVGRHAADLAARDTLSAFDPGSAFERMLDLDFNLLLLGANVNAISLLHLSEQRAAVPYRFWKDFSGQVHGASGWEPRTYRMYARDMALDPRGDLRAVQERLQARGQWRSLPLNYGHISLCRMADFVTAVDEFLAADPWSLITNRP